MKPANRLASALFCALVLSVACALPAFGAPISGGLSAPGPDDGVSLTAAGAFVGRSAHFTGSVPAGESGGAVQIQRSTGPDTWETIATTTADSDGSFTATWQADRAGAFTVRALTGSSDSASAAQDDAAPTGPATARLLVYRAAKATWYGDASLAGRKTACGQTLSPTLIGVANKTLPCGTRVAFYYKGHRVVAPVIDRGPFAGDRAFDLTYAAAKRLDMLSDGVGRVGWLSLGR